MSYYFVSLWLRKFANGKLPNATSIAGYNFVCVTNINIEDNFNSFEPDNGISVFPNPSDGETQILSTKSGITYIGVLDQRDQIVYSAKYNTQQNVEIDLSKYPAEIYIS